MALAGVVVLGAMGAVVAVAVLLQVGWGVAVPGVVALGVVGVFAVRGAGVRGAVGAMVAGVLAYGAVLGFELPRLGPLWISPRVAPLLAGRVGAVGFAEPSLMVLGGTGVAWLRREEAVVLVEAGGLDTLVVGDRDVEAIRAAVGGVLRAKGEVRGFNYSRGRWVTLTVFERI